MDIALQIMPSGVTFALRPDTSRVDDIMSMYVRWPRHRPGAGNLSTDLQEKILIQRLIAQMMDRSAAESVLLAIADGTPRHCIDGTLAALERAGCDVFARDPNEDGSAGLMSDWLSGIDVTERRLRPSRLRSS